MGYPETPYLLQRLLCSSQSTYNNQPKNFHSLIQQSSNCKAHKENRKYGTDLSYYNRFGFLKTCAEFLILGSKLFTVATPTSGSKISTPVNLLTIKLERASQLIKNSANVPVKALDECYAIFIISQPVTTCPDPPPDYHEKSSPQNHSFNIEFHTK